MASSCSASPRPAASRVLRILGPLLMLLIAFVPGAPVAAHTGFDSSSPAEGEVIDAPVGVVTLRFTGAPTAIDDGFSALDGDGTVRSPTSVTSPEPGVFDVVFDPALAGGQIGVRWSVRAADGHVLDGGFAFTVDAAPTTTLAVPTTDGALGASEAPASDEPEVADVPVTDASDSTADADDAGTTVTDATDAAADDSGGESATAGDAPSTTTAEAVVTDAPAETDLDDFLAADSGVAGEGRGSIGRILTIPAAATVIGGLAMLLWVFRGSASEIRGGVRVVQVAAGLVVLGAVLQYSGSIAATGDSFFSAFASGTERSMALLALGAVVVAAGTMASAPAEPGRSHRSLSAATATHVSRDASATSAGDRRVQWRPAFPAVLAVGAALIVVSYWFDGHTVTRGPRIVHAAVNSVHVLAGSIWFAGVAMLAAVAWWRHLRGARLDMARLVVRFSTLAALSLASVVAAGGVMAVMVLDGFGDLWGTPWGRVLLLKSGAVAIAAAVGGYNHWVLKPVVEADPDGSNVNLRLRTALTVEAIMLGFVLVVTATLVATQT